MDFLSRLRQGPLLFDGGLGSLLIARGLPGGAPPERWVLERPEEVQRVHREYFEAGADVVQSVSFGGTALKLQAAGLAGREGEVNRGAAELVVAARPAGRYASGDMGPTGHLLRPHGDLEPGRAEDLFAEQAEQLAAGGVDLLSLETFFQLGEILAALRGIRRVTPLPVLASLTFERRRRGFFTLMGDTPAAAARALEEAGAELIGANCSLDPAEMVPLAAELRAATGVPLVLQPNAGRPELDPESGRPVYRADAEEFAARLREMVDLGIEAVGGCCGTDPQFIAAARRRLDRKGEDR